MRNRKIKLRLYFATALVALAGMVGFSLQAATLPTNAHVRFITPLSIIADQIPDFGNVATGPANRVITLSTTGAISGPNSADYISGAKAGSYSIIGSANDTVDITINNYSPNAGVTPSAATCAYNGGAVSSPCNLVTQTSPGAGKTLLVGLTMTTTTTSTDNTVAVPGFDIVVNYD